MLMRVDSQTPLYDDVRDIAISRRTSVILLSFEQVHTLPCTCPVARISPLVLSPPGRTPALETRDRAGQEPTEPAESIHGPNEPQAHVCGQRADLHRWVMLLWGQRGAVCALRR